MWMSILGRLIEGYYFSTLGSWGITPTQPFQYFSAETVGAIFEIAMLVYSRVKIDTKSDVFC